MLREWDRMVKRPALLARMWIRHGIKIELPSWGSHWVWKSGFGILKVGQ